MDTPSIKNAPLADARQPERKSAPPAIDPRRRVYIPIEKRDVRGFWHFQTHDKVQYVRHPQTGEIRRVRREAR